jgi:integrase
MEQMPRIMPPLLYRELNRHGTVVFYVRVGKGARIRVRGAYGTPEFAQNYQTALLGRAPQSSPVTATGTLGWLITCYQGLSAWERLSASTKRHRAYTYKTVIARAGDTPLAAITAKTIQQGIEDRAKTPFAANDFLKAMRAVFQWAAKSQLAEDVTKGVTGFPHRTEGFHVWTDEEVTDFESRWPVGTRERLAFSILLYTGLRRGDAAMLGRQHIRDGVISLRTAKTGQQVTIPLLPQLAGIINATQTGDLAFIAKPDGAPMTKQSFGEWFRLACKAAGVPGRAHGLRKAGATRAANNGATEAELNAIFGWSGGRMASLYTRNADRVGLARRAMRKMIE